MVEAQHLVIEIGYYQAWHARVVIVARVHAHTRPRLSILAERQPRVHRNLVKRSVARIAVELIGLRVIGDKQVGPAIQVIVEHRHPQRLRAGVEQSRLGCDILESAAAQIAKQPAGGAAVGFRSAVGLLLAVESAAYVLLRRPLYVIAHEQVEQPVAIVVEP
jgi:hypothetical protein